MKTYKITLVGCGKIAKKHLKAIHFFLKKRKKNDFKVELFAVVDPLKKNADMILEQYRGKNTVLHFHSLEEMFERTNEMGEKIDIVLITTPSGLHYEQAKIALRQHCHVLVEKPITLKIAEAEELLSLAEVNQCQIAVGHIYRYFPVLQEFMQDLQKGRFGKALYGNVQVRWGHDQAYYDQAAWRGTRALDGGAIMNQSIHALDLLRWLLGEPQLLSAKGYVSTQIHQMESEDLGMGIFSFANDIWLLLEGTTNTHKDRPEAGFFVKYEKGEIRASLIKKKMKFSILDDAQKELKYYYLKKDLGKRIKTLGFSSLKQITNPHTGILFDLLKSIESGQPPLADGHSGLEALRLVEALYCDAGVE